MVPSERSFRCCGESKKALLWPSSLSSVQQQRRHFSRVKRRVKCPMLGACEPIPHNGCQDTLGLRLVCGNSIHLKHPVGIRFELWNANQCRLQFPCKCLFFCAANSSIKFQPKRRSPLKKVPSEKGPQNHAKSRPVTRFSRDLFLFHPWQRWEDAHLGCYGNGVRIMRTVVIS